MHKQLYHGEPARARLWGAAMCAGSAASFGAMAIVGKLAFEAGVGVLTLLLVRFVLAGSILGAASRLRRGAARLPTGRTLAVALGLGAVGYTAQAALYFAALTRIDAGLAAIVLYLYPAMVTLGAVLLGRDRLDRVRRCRHRAGLRRAVLVVLAGGTGALDPLGVACSFVDSSV